MDELWPFDRPSSAAAAVPRCLRSLTSVCSQTYQYSRTKSCQNTEKCWFSNSHQTNTKASIFVSSPNIVVVVVAVCSCTEHRGCVTLEAMQGQSALTRSHIDFREIHRTELYPPDEISSSVLCKQAQLCHSQTEIQEHSGQLWVSFLLKSGLISHTGTHPLDKARLAGHLEVPQIQISTFWPCNQSGGMGGMPLQRGDPAVKGAGGTVEMIRGQRANKRLLKTLNEMTDLKLKNLQIKLNITFHDNYVVFLFGLLLKCWDCYVTKR